MNHFPLLWIINSQRLINSFLCCSLLWFKSLGVFTFLIIKKNIIINRNLNAFSKVIKIINSFVYTVSVPFFSSSLLHNFNISFTSKTCWATLRSIIHNCNLSLKLSSSRRLIDIFNCNGWSNRIEVRWNSVVTLKWILFSEVKLFVNHLQTICINIHFTSSVKSI